MTKPIVKSEAWIKVVSYEDGTVKVVPYPDAHFQNFHIRRHHDEAIDVSSLK